MSVWAGVVRTYSWVTKGFAAVWGEDMRGACAPGVVFKLLKKEDVIYKVCHSSSVHMG